MEACEKYANTIYNVGDKVICLEHGTESEITQLEEWNNGANRKERLWCNNVENKAHGKNRYNALIMKDGVWARIVTPAAKDELNEKLEELTKLAESKGKKINITFD